jgi:hypothetical protein
MLRLLSFWMPCRSCCTASDFQPLPMPAPCCGNAHRHKLRVSQHAAALSWLLISACTCSTHACRHPSLTSHWRAAHLLLTAGTQWPTAHLTAPTPQQTAVQEPSRHNATQHPICSLAAKGHVGCAVWSAAGLNALTVTHPALLQQTYRASVRVTLQAWALKV